MPGKADQPAKVLIDGQWRRAASSAEFQAENPATCELLPERFPTSRWKDLDGALSASTRAAAELSEIPGEVVAAFLETYARHIEARCGDIVSRAHDETVLPIEPRLRDVELPRTTGQLRQAAAAAREGSWQAATIDSKLDIRSRYASIGPVVIFGPNNFPLAFNSICGGDFAAALAAGNPVIAKAHPSHPGTTRLLAEAAHEAVVASGLPAASVQLLYHFDNDDGLRLVADRRVGAVAFTGSRRGGLRLKAAADAAGTPIYLEMSSVNPVVVLPGALEERGAEVVDAFCGSCLMAAGQFCTNPGLVFVLAGSDADELVAAVAKRFETTPPGTLLSSGVEQGLETSVTELIDAGAELVSGHCAIDENRCSRANTLLRTSGELFLSRTDALQAEAFGNAAMIVVAHDAAELLACLERLEGNLTGTIYSATDGRDDALAGQVAARFRPRVGRLLNDKMPTGVAVSPAMNHGGPYPATGHPGFTAVGIPASMRRFARLECYDQVRPGRLPACLRDEHPGGGMWRSIDGRWSQGDVLKNAD